MARKRSKEASGKPSKPKLLSGGNPGVRLRSSRGEVLGGAWFLSPQGDILVRRYGTLLNGKTAILQTLLEPGAYEVTLNAKGYQPAQRQVAIKAGEFAEAVFTLARE